MEKIVKRDIKKFGLLILIYLILQYLSVFMIENMRMLIGNNASYFTEYLYIFLMVVAIIFLTLGSLLLFVYLIVRPAIEDKKQEYDLSEGIILYRLLGLVFLFFLGLFNFFVALALITGFDLKILFEQSINLYIGLSFGIQAVLSLILIGYNKIYNNKIFSSKLNILFNIIILLIIYVAGNLYYYYYFQYGMPLLLTGYIFLFLNIKLVCKDVLTNKITKVVWGILVITIVLLFGLSFIKGENVSKEEAIYEENIGEKIESEVNYSYEEIDSKFGTIRKYDIGGESTDYIFMYNDRKYELTVYPQGEVNLYMEGIESREHLGIYPNSSEYYYVEGNILVNEENSEDTYLTCSGSYTEEELETTNCIDDDIRDVLEYVKENF